MKYFTELTLYINNKQVQYHTWLQWDEEKCQGKKKKSTNSCELSPWKRRGKNKTPENLVN